MKKIIFGIFAHPDDEAFGPCGTFLQETKNGADLHLITLTLGEAGRNPDRHPDLSALRCQEWKLSGKLMQAKSMHFLGYKDGHLTNTDMINAGQKILELVSETLQPTPAASQVEFITIDLNGVTGHIDHIVAARAATWAFYRLRSQGETRLTRLRYTCVPKDEWPTHNTNWIYMEAGRPKSQIDEVIDAREYHDEIVNVMSAHHSQRQDFESHITKRGRNLGLNYFIVKD